MENKVLINYIVDATLNFLRKEYAGLDEEFYCEVENINYEYFEGDYDDEYISVKARCGRYKEGEDDFYNFDYDFTLNDVKDKSADFIAGMVQVKIKLKMSYYDLED